MAYGDHDPRTLARRFYALGDEIRLEVLGLLRGGERCVCELTGCLGLAQSRLSVHLKVLKDAGLISERRQGTRRLYVADAQALGELRAAIEAMWREALGGMAARIDEELNR
jgi:ArsR family transcriptional regulator